jgi:site-specific DNA-methyltransferase (adenine-specific)
MRVIEKNVVHHLDYRRLLKRISDASVKCVLTDAPYGINYTAKKWVKNHHKIIINDEKDFSYETLARESYRILKDKSIIIAFTGWSVYADHYKHIEEAGFTMKQPIICQKRVSVGGAVDANMQNNSEWAILGFKGKFKFRETKLIKNKNSGLLMASTIVEETKQHNGLLGEWETTTRSAKKVECAEYKKRMPACWFGPEFPYSTESGVSKARQEFNHPTMKGLEFIKWLIQLTTDEGDTIVDPFSGSASISLACKQLNRNFIAGDISKEFVDMGNRRLRMNLY